MPTSTRNSTKTFETPSCRRRGSSSASQLHDDRSVVDLLSANYTYVNERLARHYQIPNVYGSHFRRVSFADGVRGGLLGQASIMTVTSYPNRTSPVRGQWLLENMLGSPPPPPPPDVPALKNAEDNLPHSVRERMEAHRSNPGCAVCHVRMDPLGFSLENFDALGKWRTVSDGASIDASASLPDGTRFEGIAGLRTLLLSHREDFVRTFTEKLLAYALGRRRSATTCRPFAPSCGTRPPTTIAGRRSFSESSRVGLLA